MTNKILTALIIVIFCSINFPQIKAKPILDNYLNVLDYGAKNDGKSDNVEAFARVVAEALKLEKNIYLPAGVYSLKSYFPLRNTSINILLDCKNITVFGEGEKTIIMTNQVGGNDVFQLNALKNVTISNLAITSKIGNIISSKHGSNGVSITNGGENIKVEKLHIYNLPHKPYHNYFDGSKGITIQPGNSKLNTRNITIVNNIIYNSIYGISLDFNNLNINVPLPKNIVINNNIIKNCLLGLSMGMVGNAPVYQENNYLINSNTFNNCKHAAVFVRMSAFNFSDNVITYDRRYRNKKIWREKANWINNYNNFGGLYVNSIENSHIINNSFILKDVDSSYISDIYGKKNAHFISNKILNNKFNSINKNKNINLL